LEILPSKESTAPIPLAYVSAKRLNGNSFNNSKKEAWFDEDMFFNEANPTKVNTATSDNDVYLVKRMKLISTMTTPIQSIMTPILIVILKMRF
jgi:hypothetical protein